MVEKLAPSRLVPRLLAREPQVYHQLPAQHIAPAPAPHRVEVRGTRSTDAEWVWHLSVDPAAFWRSKPNILQPPTKPCLARSSAEVDKLCTRIEFNRFLDLRTDQVLSMTVGR